MNEENQNFSNPVQSPEPTEEQTVVLETPPTPPVEEVPETPETPETPVENNNRLYYIVAAVVAVIVLLAALMYVMEKDGRIQTGLFDGVDRIQSERTVVATVNDSEISEYDLRISMEQIGAAATAQGVDTTDPEVQSSIKGQAIEMLVNTELLKQEAAVRGLTVTAEDVDARYQQLLEEVGGEEVLMERMEQFGVTDKILKRDIRNELIIQQLLDQVFAETEISVSEEEVLEMYNNAGGEAAGLPPLEEVRGQIEQQINTTKEQEIVNTFVDGLREKSEVNVLTEV